MKAKLYRLGICDSVLDLSHGFTREIREIYIPELNICFNSENNSTHCFESGCNRYKENSKLIKNIEIPEDIAKILKNYIKSQKKLNKVVSWAEGKKLLTREETCGMLSKVRGQIRKTYTLEKE